MTWEYANALAQCWLRPARSEHPVIDHRSSWRPEPGAPSPETFSVFSSNAQLNRIHSTMIRTVHQLGDLVLGTQQAMTGASAGAGTLAAARQVLASAGAWVTSSVHSLIMHRLTQDLVERSLSPEPCFQSDSASHSLIPSMNTC